MSFDITPDPRDRYPRKPFVETPPDYRKPTGRPSSIRDRIDPRTLENINHAIIANDPPTLTGIFNKFNLAQRGVSYQAFHRYARRVRLAEDLGIPDPHAAARASVILDRLPDLVAELLIEICTEPAPASRTVHRLCLAYRAVTNTMLARHSAAANRRNAAIMEGTSRREIQAIAETARQLRRIAGLPPADSAPAGECDASLHATRSHAPNHGMDATHPPSDLARGGVG